MRGLMQELGITEIEQEQAGWSYHHIGTCRMGANPATSVVDANLRVHGTSNLYVAGSAVFVTGGASNPTLTIAALSHRLGDHLTAAYATVPEAQQAQPPPEFYRPETPQPRAALSHPSAQIPVESTALPAPRPLVSL